MLNSAVFLAGPVAREPDSVMVPAPTVTLGAAGLAVATPGLPGPAGGCVVHRVPARELLGQSVAAEEQVSASPSARSHLRRTAP